MGGFHKIFWLLILVFALTQIGLAQTYIYKQDFNDCEKPTGWQTLSVGSNDSTAFWQFGRHSPDLTNAGNIDGTCMAIFDDDWLDFTGGDSSQLLSPIIDVSGHSTVFLHFDYNYRQLGASEFFVEVWDSTQWVNVLQVNSNACGLWGCAFPYPHAAINVSAFKNPEFRVRFTYSDGNGWQWYVAIDNFRVTNSPCSLAAIPGQDTSICQTDTFRLGGTATALNGTPPYQYLWSPNVSLNANTIGKPIAVPNASITYGLSVSDALGCLDSSIIVIGVDTCYHCTPISDSSTMAGDFINSVWLANLANINSGGTSGLGYSDLTYENSGGAANLQIDGSYFLAIQNGPTRGQAIAAWIDFNDDAVFTGQHEKLGEAWVEVNDTGFIQFYIPCDSILAERYLRLRIRSNPDSSALHPCNLATYGETEDYSVFVSDPYCKPVYSIGGINGHFIQSVKLEEIENLNSGQSASGSFSYPVCESARLISGNTYALEISGNPTHAENYAAWIDYNQSLSFTVAEKLGQIVIGPSENQKVTFTIPVAATPGETRLRIRSNKFSGSIGPCAILEEGEAEDYKVEVIPQIANDGGLLAVQNLVSGCGLTTTESVVLVVKNFGSDTLQQFPIALQVNQNQIIRDTAFQTLAPNDTLVFSINQSIDLQSPGEYDFSFWSEVPGDTYDFNDTITDFQIVSFITIDTFPYLQSFENGNGGWIPGGSQSSWELGTPAKTTIIGASEGNMAWTTGGSGANLYNSNEQSFLFSPCFDLTTLIAPQIQFDIWFETEPNLDGAVFQTSKDEGVSWQNLGPAQLYSSSSITARPGNQSIGWTGSLGQWVTVTQYLSGLGGEANIRLRLAFGSNGSLEDDGVGLDNVRITEGPPDVKVVAIDEPVGGCGLTVNEQISIRLSNPGSTIITDLPVSLLVNNLAVLFDTVAGPIHPTDTIQYIFSSTVDLSGSGVQTVKAVANLDGDGSVINNNKEVALINSSETAPYFHGFDGLIEDQTNPVPLYGGWVNVLNDNGDGQDWWIKAGSTPTASTGPNGDHTTGFSKYLYVEDSFYDNLEVSVETPCIDLGTLDFPLISFWSHSKDSSGFPNTLHVDVFSEGIWTIDAIAPITPQTNTWNLEAVDLGPWTSKKVKTRFRVNNANGQEGNDIAIDDFRVVNNPCPVPFGLQDSAFTGGVTISWRLVPGANSYKLNGRRMGNNAWLSLGINDTSFTANNLSPGATYEWRVKSTCTGGSSLYSELDSFTVPNSGSKLAFPEQKKAVQSDFKIWPNPSDGAIFITCNSQIFGEAFTLRIFNFSGQLVSSWTGKTTSHSISITTDPPEGIYLVEIVSDGQTQRNKLVIHQK